MELALTVSNPLSVNGSTAAGGGHGILGMRERAALLGGTLDARSSSGRFVVTARLPYQSA